MRPIARYLLGVIASMSAIAFGLLLAGPALAAGTAVPSPNVGTGPNSLNDVSIATADSAWSVGYHAPPDHPYRRRPLAEHWDGSSWSVVSAPDPPATVSAELEGVSAVSPDDVWAVGTSSDPSALGSRTLVEHWDGTSWAIVPAPNPGGPNFPNRLHEIEAVAVDDIWAVGVYWEASGSSYRQRSLIAHWDGTRWRAVPNPGVAELFSISAASPKDIWAVGPNQVLHWNGRKWEATSVAPGDGTSVVLKGVGAVAHRFVWAVGFRQFSCSDGLCARPLVERRGGGTWSVDDVGIEGFGGLESIAATSATDTWAVGAGGSRGGTLVLHWDGAQWQLEPTPHRGHGDLLGVDALPTKTWAVGDRYSERSQSARTLIFRFSSRSG